MKTKTEVFKNEKGQSTLYTFSDSIDLNLNSKILNFKNILIEQKTHENKNNIFLACDVSTDLVLEISKTTQISVQDIAHLSNSEKVAIVFSLKDEVLRKYFNNEKLDNITEIQDEKGNKVIFNLTNYNIDELLAYVAC